MKPKLLHLQSLAATVLGVIMAFAFVSCSHDDKGPDANSLTDTTWTILSCVDNSDGESDDDFVGLTITFKKDGNVKFSPATDWTYAKWSLNGNTLKLVLGEGMPDDYMEGIFVINGNNATYKYSWYDYEGEWGGEDHYSMTLLKK